MSNAFIKVGFSGQRFHQEMENISKGSNFKFFVLYTDPSNIWAIVGKIEKRFKRDNV